MEGPLHRLADAMITLVERRFHESPAERVDPGEVRRVLVNGRNELSREALRAGFDADPYRDDPLSDVLKSMDVAKAIVVYLENEERRPVDRRERLVEWKAGYAVVGLGGLGVLFGAVLGMAVNPFLGILVAVLGCLGLVIGVSLMGIGEADYRPSRALREQRRSDCRALIADKLHPSR